MCQCQQECRRSCQHCNPKHGKLLCVTDLSHTAKSRTGRPAAIVSMSHIPVIWPAAQAVQNSTGMFNNIGRTEEAKTMLLGSFVKKSLRLAQASCLLGGGGGGRGVRPSFAPSSRMRMISRISP